MSVSGISGSLFGFNNPTVQSKAQQIQQEFQQLGEDLQSGNLSAAQSDYATLEQLVPQNSASSTSSTPSTQSSNPLAQAFNQLGQDRSPGICLRRSRILPRFSRICRTRLGKCRPTVIIITTGAAATDRIRLASCSNSWDRNCSRAIFRRRNRATTRSPRTCSRSEPQARRAVRRVLRVLACYL